MDRGQLHRRENARSTRLATALLICAVGVAGAVFAGCGVDTATAPLVQTETSAVSNGGAEDGTPTSSSLGSTTSSTVYSQGATTDAGQGTLSSDGAAPAARFGHCMVYSPATGKIILFGGSDWDDELVDDLWTYDPAVNTWAEVHLADDSPSGSFGSSMVCDPASGKAILLGGPENYIWTCDSGANAWTRLDDEGIVPYPRSFYSAVYDAIIGKVILYGGMVDEDSSDLTTPWAYDPDANTWTEVHPTGDAPTARGAHAMVYDPATGKMILFGGIDIHTEEALNDTWAYDAVANTWTQLDPKGDMPSARGGHSMVYDPASGKVILFGGAGGPDEHLLDDTWAYDPAGNSWTKLDPTGDLPAARAALCMVYDAVGRRMVLFGGMGLDGPLDDTWAYDPAANTWTKLGGVAASSTSDSQELGAGSEDAAAKSLIRNAMTAIESAYVDLRTFDPATMTPAVLGSIEPSITFISATGTSAATAPTAGESADTVNYFGTATTYAVGVVSESGKTFGVIADRGAEGYLTWYIDGVAADW